MTGAQPQISAVGVYRWPFTDADVNALVEWLYSNPTAADVEVAREQLNGLVVIELRVEGGSLDLVNGLSQVPPGKRTENDQVPYCETWWDESGSVVIGKTYEAPPAGPCRLVYFLHFFQPEAPLYTGQGAKIDLPSISTLPARLAEVLKYDAP